MIELSVYWIAHTTLKVHRRCFRQIHHGDGKSIVCQ